MLTDRRARELLWPIYAMSFIIQDGVPEDQRTDPDYIRFMECVGIAEAEIAALHGKSPKEWRKVALSTMRAVGDAVRPYIKADAEVGKIGLIVFFVLQRLIETGYFEYSGGSAIDEAMVLYMAAIDHHAEADLKRRSAEKQAKHMMRELQRLGYFKSAETWQTA